MNHYSGYDEVRERILTTNDLAELFEVLDSLYGREQINGEEDLDTVRDEALRQLEMEWRDTPVEPEHIQKMIQVMMEGKP